MHIAESGSFSPYQFGMDSRIHVPMTYELAIELGAFILRHNPEKDKLINDNRASKALLALGHQLDNLEPKYEDYVDDANESDVTEEEIAGYRADFETADEGPKAA